MKLRLLFFGTLMLMLFLSSSNQVLAEEGHEETGTCDTPTQFIAITADPDVDGSLSFDKTDLKVDKDTCVELTFTNKSPAVEHDFSVDEDTELGVSEIHVHMLNNKAGLNGTDFKVVNFKTPNVDATVEYYCSVTGHRDGGMFGDLVIGEGGSVPGFELSLALIALFSLIAIPQLRKRN